ncbi:MAG: universal stress protein [Gemmatimonadaceae bacterium]|nr:universal stress protein [Gemmatimonadaceae bacterium]
MTSTATTPTDAPECQPLAPFVRPLVATDATSAADGAVRLGAALAARDGASLSAISVVEPAPYPMPVNDLAMSPTSIPSAEEAACAARAEAVRAQYARIGLTVPDDLFVECSVPLSGILFRATARKSDLIILGLGRHKAVDRLFGTETALHAVREADITTLAVPHGMTELPRYAIVGTDFDASSLAAVKAAARLVGPTGRITLVHVDPLVDPIPSMLADWPPHVLDRLNDAFTRMLRQLALPDTMDIDTVPLTGNVGKELVAFAGRVHADVIVVGRHQRSLVERVVLGSTATRVVRTATSAVMVVPRCS